MKYIIALILFAPLLRYSQANDSALNARFNRIELNLKRDNDSLRRELQMYKAKEDYYATALSDQSTRFSVIVSDQSSRFSLITSIIAGIAVALTFVGYYQLKQHFEQRIKVIDDTIVSKLKEINDSTVRRELTRLENIYEFYFNYSNKTLIDALPEIEFPAAVRESMINKFSRFSVSILKLESMLEMNNLMIENNIKDPESVANAQPLSMEIEFCLNDLKGINKVLRAYDAEKEGKDIKDRQLLLSTFGVNFRVIRRILLSNKDKTITTKLYKIHHELENLIGPDSFGQH